MRTSTLRAYFIIALLMLAPLSGFGADLTIEQQTAKSQGIVLYNQFKAISATPLLKIAADAGDPDAQYYLAEAIRKNKKYMTAEALGAYEASALQGNIYSMIRLAGDKNDLCVAMGNCPKGRKEPEAWGKMALDTASLEAAKGNAEAMYLMYRVTGDDKWLEKSAEKGFAFAQYFLGIRYRGGHGFFLLPSSRAEAVEHLMKAAAEGGYPQGMLEYGAILAEKKTCKDSDSEREGRRNWLCNRSVWIWIVPRRGTFGVWLSLRPVRSYALLHLLLELDGGGGMPDYVNFALPDISAQMTVEQIEKAKKNFLKNGKCRTHHCHFSLTNSR